MSYQVLARKWRPRNFEQLVGQEHVSRALINGLDHERLHHAFLFTGTRGVGKTTIARILSKSLNCETGITSKPCGACSSCTEIDEGRFVDLIEVDAASRTKVEDTRDLLDNVQYAPTRGRYKVYLIDEVHMLSNHSFNALLKTLEEPPPHIKFLLATTDPQKLPITILSRCLQFNLKKLSASDIVGYLQHILEQENIESEESALRLLARGAEGSMRDALSLLDQAIAFGGGKVTDDDVRSMLGTIESGHVYQLIRQIHAADANALMQTIRDLDQRSPEYIDVLAEMISVLHHIALEKQVSGGITEEWDDPEQIRDLAKNITPQDLQLYYQIALQGREDMKMNPIPKEGFEMTVLRMIAFRPWQETADTPPGQQSQKPEREVSGVSKSESKSSSPVATEKAKPVLAQKQPTPAADENNVQAPVSKPAQTPLRSADLPDWHEIFADLKVSAIPQQLAANCQIENIEDDIVRLILDQAHAQLLTTGPIQRLETALAEYFNRDIKLKIQPGIVPDETPAQRKVRQDEERQKAAVESIEQDENIQLMKEMFGATVPQNTIQPLDE
ncbi:MAG: DNA polymerase III subunit gamma/tau [Gammaproteobacteria bacterium]|nr:MAG: DNA polymerase III subunit gamma/tau [Gammaproteobacteria bacterium]